MALRGGFDSPTRRAQRPLYQLSYLKRKLGAPSRIRTCASSSCEPQRHARGAALLDYSTAGNPGLSGDLPISLSGLNVVDVWGIEPQRSPHWLAPLR